MTIMKKITALFKVAMVLMWELGDNVVYRVILWNASVHVFIFVFVLKYEPESKFRANDIVGWASEC